MNATHRKLYEIAQRGFCCGYGNPAERLCVMSAVALAMGEPHSGEPTCVAGADQIYAVAINDAEWESAEERADALLPLGLAAMGTAGTDREPWVRRLVEGTIRRVVPIHLRALAGLAPDHAPALEAAALRCETEASADAARAAAAAAAAAYVAPADDATAATAADDATVAADYAADAYAATADDDDATVADAAHAAYASHSTVALRESVEVALDAYAAEGRDGRAMARELGWGRNR